MYSRRISGLLIMCLALALISPHCQLGLELVTFISVNLIIVGIENYHPKFAGQLLWNKNAAYKKNENNQFYQKTNIKTEEHYD